MGEIVDTGKRRRTKRKLNRTMGIKSGARSTEVLDKCAQLQANLSRVLQAHREAKFLEDIRNQDSDRSK